MRSQLLNAILALLTTAFSLAVDRAGQARLGIAGALVVGVAAWAALQWVRRRRLRREREQLESMRDSALW